MKRRPRVSFLRRGAGRRIVRAKETYKLGDQSGAALERELVHLGLVFLFRSWLFRRHFMRGAAARWMVRALVGEGAGRGTESRENWKEELFVFVSSFCPTDIWLLSINVVMECGGEPG